MPVLLRCLLAILSTGLVQLWASDVYSVEILPMPPATSGITVGADTLLGVAAASPDGRWSLVYTADAGAYTGWYRIDAAGAAEALAAPGGYARMQGMAIAADGTAAGWVATVDGSGAITAQHPWTAAPGAQPVVDGSIAGYIAAIAPDGRLAGGMHVGTPDFATLSTLRAWSAPAGAPPADLFAGGALDGLSARIGAVSPDGVWLVGDYLAGDSAIRWFAWNRTTATLTTWGLPAGLDAGIYTSAHDWYGDAVTDDGTVLCRVGALDDGVAPLRSFVRSAAGAVQVVPVQGGATATGLSSLARVDGVLIGAGTASGAALYQNVLWRSDAPTVLAVLRDAVAVSPAVLDGAPVMVPDGRIVTAGVDPAAADPNAAASRRWLRLAPMPRLTVARSAATMAEASATGITATVARSGSTAAALVTRWVPAAAGLGSAYTVSGSGVAVSGGEVVLTIPAGAASGTVTLLPVDNALHNSDVAVSLVATAPSGAAAYTTGTAYLGGAGIACTITDDDPIPVPVITQTGWGAVPTLSIVFSEAVTGFTSADLASASTALSVTGLSGGGTTWSATLAATAGAQGAAAVSIAAGAAQSLADGEGCAAAALAVAYDHAGPALPVVSDPAAGATVASSFPITGTCDQDVARIILQVVDGSGAVIDGEGLFADDNGWVAAISGLAAGSAQISVWVDDEYGNRSGPLVVPVQVPVDVPVITSASTAAAQAGAAFSFALAASNAPTAFAASGLPAGLSLASATGVISGTPTAVGSHPVQVSASNAGGTGPAAVLTIVVAAAPDPGTSASGGGGGGGGCGLGSGLALLLLAGWALALRRRG